MPQILISDETYSKLQELAQPFVDTPDTVISRLIRSYDAPLDEKESRSGQRLKFDPNSPPTLTFTKMREAHFGNDKLDRPSWAELVRVSLGYGLREWGFERLKASTDANIVKGIKDTEGYSYIPELGISLQGEDAKDCWTIAYSLARKLRQPIRVVFDWRSRDGAAHPGETGEMTWEP